MSERSSGTKHGKMGSLSDSLSGRAGVSPGYVRLQEALLRYRSAELGSETLPSGFPSPAAGDDAVSRGRSVAREIELIPESKALHASLKRLLEAVAGHCELPSSFLEWTRTSAAGDGILEKLFRAVTRSDTKLLETIAKKSGQDKELLDWIGRELAKPFFQRYSRVISSESLAKWNRGRCPCCGGAARMARLEKETGRRYLWCDLCAVEWPFVRLQCPFCGNDDAEQLGNLEPEGQETYRIAVCQKCKGYLRTVDERKLPEGVTANLPLEDIATLPLNFVAEREGYRLPHIGLE